MAAGDDIKLDFAGRGCRCYLGVADGFTVEPSFGSTATVTREHIGGLRGEKLKSGDLLPQCRREHAQYLYLAAHLAAALPGHGDPAGDTGLPAGAFQPPAAAAPVQPRLHRLRALRPHGLPPEGPAIACDIDGILSEGICFGAIQIPQTANPLCCSTTARP